MSNMSGLNTALTGLRAGQVGLDTVSHNIANANTIGYTRQRVSQTARAPFQSLVGPIGTGTDVSLGRMRDAFLDARARAASAQFGYFDSRAELLRRTESILAEPNEGLSTELGALWNSFEDLAAAPNDLAARQQVLAALNSLTTRVRTVSTQWDRLSEDTATDMGVAVAEANDVFAQIAELNRVIPGAEGGGGVSGDLLDKRDELVDRVANSLGATTKVEPNGTVTVMVGTVTTVSGITTNPLTVGADHQLRDAGGTVAVAGGKVGAMRDFIVTELPKQHGALDALVQLLADNLNTVHAQGRTPTGAAGGPLLAYDPAVGAARSLTVATTAPQDLAAAGPDPADPTAPPAAHDGRNALALADLRSARVSAGGRSIDDELRGLVVDLAAVVASSGRVADANKSLNLAATLARQSAHGVSLDEEMVDLVKYQRSLEASSRVMTALDEALNKLVNGTGIVGR